MADKFSKETRSYIMSQIRSSHTKPEMALKKALRGTYLRHQPKGIIGNPDFGNKKQKIAVFIDGCFWHGCPKCYRKPKSNTGYWLPKLKKNKKRDTVKNRMLKARGWKVVRFWEHDVLKSPAACAEIIKNAFPQ